jgi:hypothetical protein
MPNRKIGDGVSFIVSTSFTESQLGRLEKAKGNSRSAFIRNSAMLCADYPHLAEALEAMKKGFYYNTLNKTCPVISENAYIGLWGGQLALFDRDIFCAYVSDYGNDWTL